MCFISSGINLTKEDIIKILPKMSSRGRDGVGIFLTNGEKISIFKSLKNADSMNYESIVKINPKVFLANSRAVPAVEFSTGSGYEEKNQQPFTSNKERFFVVHNGIISNDKELIKQFKLNPHVNVDSAILPCLFDKVGVVKGLKLLKGSYAILCYDKVMDKFYAAKNFMPLTIFFNKNSNIGFASLDKGAEDIWKEHIAEIKPYTCLEISIEDMEIKTYSLYPRKKNKRVLVICSGGADSVTTAYIYKYLGYEVGLIHFKYGQAAQMAEEFCVKRISKKLNAKLYIYDLKDCFKMFKKQSLLLSNKIPDSSKQLLDAESMLSYVPARNSIMAMVSAGIAEMNNYDTVAIGVQQEDSVYIDNNPGYVDAINQLYKYSLKWNTNIDFKGPIQHIIKHEVFSIGKKLGVDFITDSTSCYYPKIKSGKLISCGKCGCCLYKTNALKMIEEKDKVGNVNVFINKYIKPYI